MSCLATTRKGKPCRFRVAIGEDYCLNHRQGANTTSAATHAARARHEPAIHLLDAAFGLYSRSARPEKVV